ncbi:hypothetical protein ACMGDH_10000 [Sphingomonas sp. DT-207]|uniref:hypothetical protein n=1 Tax=Sphingomonas sp. DT-207 TaxID=3396167 RepID=UPI003F1A3BEC
MDDRREKPIVTRDAEASDFPHTGVAPQGPKPDADPDACDGDTELDIIFEFEALPNGPN